MNHRRPLRNDIDAYLNTLTDVEREKVETASVALDIAGLAFRARTFRNLTQAEAAAESGLKQQSISRIEGGTVNVTIRTLEKYLQTLRFSLTLSISDVGSGEPVDQITLNRQDDGDDQRLQAHLSGGSVPEHPKVER